jgi:hypothetical protein
VYLGLSGHNTVFLADGERRFDFVLHLDLPPAQPPDQALRPSRSSSTRYWLGSTLPGLFWRWTSSFSPYFFAISVPALILSSSLIRTTT